MTRAATRLGQAYLTAFMPCDRSTRCGPGRHAADC